MYKDCLRSLVSLNNNKELHNSTGAARDDPSYTASEPAVALRECVDIFSASKTIIKKKLNDIPN